MILGKKIGAAVLSFALVLSLLVLPAGAAGEIGVTIDGTSVLYDDGYGRPFLDSAGRTQVPFRLTMESVGCAVYWNNETRTAVAEKDGTRVEVPIGAPYLLVNGKRVEMDTTAQIVDTRTYLPIRPVMEAFGAYVTWDNANRLVVIKTGSNLLRVHFLHPHRLWGNRGPNRRREQRRRRRGGLLSHTLHRRQIRLPHRHSPRRRPRRRTGRGPGGL